MTTVVRLKWMLVAVAMVAAACGGGGATPSVDSTNPATPSKGNVVSPDGMLTVIPPAGAGDITIAEAGPIGIQSLEVATVWSFTRVPLSVDGASVVFENPAGELLDGSATVTGGPVVLSQALLYISNGEFESITSLSLDALREALAP